MKPEGDLFEEAGKRALWFLRSRGLNVSAIVFCAMHGESTNEAGHIAICASGPRSEVEVILENAGDVMKQYLADGRAGVLGTKDEPPESLQ